ncbi:MAG: DMT family transporter [Novosphingobium sp.]
MHGRHTFLPFAAALLGIALFSAMDAFMKGASLAVGSYSAMVLRSLCGVALMLPLWLARGGSFPDRSALRLHALRGAISAAMATTFFWALTIMPMAEGIAISFIAPLIALYLAAVILGEKITRGAIGGSLMGLAGVAVIAAARLGAEDMGRESALGIGAMLLSAVFYAVNLILQRKQALMAGPVEVALFQSVFCGLFLALFAPWWLVLPGPEAAGQIALSALLAAVSLMLLSWAYGKAEAQALLTVEYTAFIWAALFGWLMFAEAVTGVTLIGAVLIVIGCWIASRQGRAEHSEQTTL